MLSLEDVKEILQIPVLGVIPESHAVLKASNMGVPVVLDQESDAGQAYTDAIARFLGEEPPMRFVDQEKKGLLKRLFKFRAKENVLARHFWQDYSENKKKQLLP